MIPAPCPICQRAARRIDFATVQCPDHGTVAARRCCSTYVGQAHADGCLTPTRTLLARARQEVWSAALLSDEEAAPLLCPRGRVSDDAIAAAWALDGAAYALRRAGERWIDVRSQLRALALILAEELRASALAGRAES